MKTIKGYSILSREEQMTREDEAFRKGEIRSEARIMELERALEKSKKKNLRSEQFYEDDLEELRRANEKLRIECGVLQEERDEAADVLKMKLAVEADQLTLDARAKYLDNREAYLNKLAENMKWDKAAPVQSLQLLPARISENGYPSY